MNAIEMTIRWLRGCGPLHFGPCKFDECPLAKQERERRSTGSQPDCCEQMASRLAGDLAAEAQTLETALAGRTRQAQTLARDLTYLAERLSQ